MVTQTTIDLSSLRLIDAQGFLGDALSACLSAWLDPCTKIRIAPFTGLAHGRIVSISRGSPPPKTR